MGEARRRAIARGGPITTGDARRTQRNCSSTPGQVRPLADFPPGLLAVPCLEMMFTPSVRAITHLVTMLPPGSAVQFQEGSHSIAWKRNALVRSMLSQPSLQWVLFVDSDAVPPPDTVVRLLAHEVDIVGALHCLRFSPYPLGSSRPIGQGPGGLHQVNTLGCHCMLVRRSVFERIPEPWFEHPAPGVGEDAYFNMRADEAGIPRFVDPCLVVGHMSMLNITPEFANLYRQTAAGQAELQQWRAAGGQQTLQRSAASGA